MWLSKSKFKQGFNFKLMYDLFFRIEMKKAGKRIYYRLLTKRFIFQLSFFPTSFGKVRLSILQSKKSDSPYKRYMGSNLIDIMQKNTKQYDLGYANMQILDNLVILCPCYIIERICQLNCVHGGVTVSKITAQAYTGGTSKRSSYHRRGRDFSSWPTTSLNLSQGLSTVRSPAERLRTLSQGGVATG